MTQQKPQTPLNLRQAMERYKLTQTPEERAFLMNYFHRLKGTLSVGAPSEDLLWQVFAEIWDQARVAGATQMRRVIVGNIGRMLDEPAPQTKPKIPPPPPIVVVEHLERKWCFECEKEAN